MFEKFTEKARQFILQAREEAIELGLTLWSLAVEAHPVFVALPFLQNIHQGQSPLVSFHQGQSFPLPHL